jgi:hypothetical protein
MRYPLSDVERAALAQLPKSARREILKMRQRRLVNTWMNPNCTTDPEWFLKGSGVQGWQETLEAISANGTQISNSTSETIICNDFNIPGYYMAPGRTIRIWAAGVMSNVVTTPGTLILRVRWGGVSGTVLLQSGAQGLDTTARTNSLWAMLCYITCQSAGASGTFMSSGIMWCNVLSSTAANLEPALLGSAGAPLASGNAAVTCDTTVSKLLSVTAQFSVSTNPTNLTCQNRTIEVLN